MKFLPVIGFFLLMPVLLSAQETIGQLISLSGKSARKEDKIDAYVKILTYYSEKNLDSVNWYAEQAMDFARSSKYDLGTARILTKLSVIDENQGRIDLGKTRALKALKIYRENKDLKGVAEITHNLGTMEANKGNYNVATKYFIDALKIYDSVTDYHGLLLNYMNLGNIYILMNDKDNAWRYFSKGVEVSNKTPLTDATIYLYNAIGVWYAGQGKQDSALQMFLKALNESGKPELLASHSESLLYLGEYYQSKGALDTAINYLQKGLSAAMTNNMPEFQSNFLMEIARIKEKSEPDSAMQYLMKAKELAERIQSKVSLANVYGDIASLLEQQGKFKEALAALREKQNLTDTVFNIDKTKEIANIGSSWQLETNQQIRELETLIKHNVRQRHELELIASVLIAFLLGLFFYWGKAKKLNKQLAIQHRQLEELNSMKDKLFSVIGHDLRGPIARIPAMIDIIEDETTTDDERKFLFDNLKEQTKVTIQPLWFLSVF